MILSDEVRTGSGSDRASDLSKNCGPDRYRSRYDFMALTPIDIQKQICPLEWFLCLG